MNRPLHPTVFRYLRSVQASDRVGLHGFFRRNHDVPRSCRTVYRWHRRLGDQFLVVPSVTVEQLGLLHAHVFVLRPDPSWLSCPYAVEAAWVTPDFCQEVLYMHCLVPAGTDLAVLYRGFRCAQYDVVLSGSGWQQFLVDDSPIVLPVPSTAGVAGDLLRRHPFVVPAMMELWQYPNSLPLAWARIRQRLGDGLKRFLPRTKIRYVNGKNHVTDAFRNLQRDGLLRQQLVRYHPLLSASVEVFVRVRLDRDDLTVLLTGLRGVLHAVETYPLVDGYWCRLLGPHQLLDAMIRLPERVREQCNLVYFHTKRHPSPVVRFAYERLFDPTTGAWSVTS